MSWFVQQAGGPLFGWGRNLQCMIYILTTDHTDDQVLQATAANNMISCMNTYANHVVKD